MNSESFQNLLDQNKIILGESGKGDEMGLDTGSPAAHRVSSTIQDATSYYNTFEAIKDKNKKKSDKPKMRYKQIYDRQADYLQRLGQVRKPTKHQDAE